MCINSQQEYPKKASMKKNAYTTTTQQTIFLFKNANNPSVFRAIYKYLQDIKFQKDINIYPHNIIINDIFSIETCLIGHPIVYYNKCVAEDVEVWLNGPPNQSTEQPANTATARLSVQ